jgi:IclR family pca regulon transcriptional regulator
VNLPARKMSLADEIYRSGDSDYMVSLARGLHVIQVFCDDGRGQLTIADITRISGLPRTVVSRCLYTLQELGFIGRDGRNFFLLPKVLKLGYGYVAAAGLPTLAQSILNKLTEETQSATAVVVLDNDDVLYVAKSSPPSTRSIVTMTLNIGHRRPAFVTASGLVLLANLPQAEFSEYLQRIRDSDTDDHSSRSSIAEISQHVDKSRQDGHALSGLVFAASMRAIAVPVRNVVGKVAAAMVVAVYDEQSSDEDLLRRYLPLIKDAALSLGDKLVE